MKQQFILDSAKDFEDKVLIYEQQKKNIIIKHFLLNTKNGTKEKGDYFTVTFDDKVMQSSIDDLKNIFKKTLKAYYKKYYKGGRILFIGLGNPSVIGDSFGPKVLENLIATNAYNDFLTIPKVALFIPDVVAKTGIPSLKVIEMLISYSQPDFLVLVDSFTTTNNKYLNHNLEINDCGMIFQEETRSNKMITSKTFNTPVLSIGYTTLLKKKDAYYTKYTLERDLSLIVDMVSKTIKEILFT